MFPARVGTPAGIRDRARAYSLLQQDARQRVRSIMQQTITVEREFLSTITTEEMLIRILWAHFRQLAAGPP